MFYNDLHSAHGHAMLFLSLWAVVFCGAVLNGMVFIQDVGHPCGQIRGIHSEASVINAGIREIQNSFLV